VKLKTNHNDNCEINMNTDMRNRPTDSIA